MHLITLLATYKHGTEYNLIFPWADTDLFGYWKRSQDPPQGDELGTWVIEQCRGLVEGLYSIHRYATFSGTSLFDIFELEHRKETTEHDQTLQTNDAQLTRAARNLFGRHGDLKPENILWYPESHSTGGHGILKITDFGIARFNTENMWDTQKTGRIPNSPSYRSPENDLDGRLTTACDVWALGCVYLQFVTWYFGGYKYLESFGERRLAVDPYWANMRTDTFFTIEESSGAKIAKTKPSVQEVCSHF